MRRKKNPWVLVAVVCLTFLYLGVGFYPFELKSLNREWASNGASFSHGVVRFTAPGMAYPDGPQAWLGRAIAHTRIAVSLDVRSAASRQFGPARILSIAAHPLQRNLVIAQQDDHLVVQVRRQSHLDGLPSYRINHVFSQPGWHKLLVRITAETVEIRADAVSLSLPVANPLLTWNTGYGLTLGNERAGTLPWLGEIRELRIDAEGSRNLLAREWLHMPPRYPITRDYPPTLVPFIHASLNAVTLLDWLLNLTAFIPLGWLVARLAGEKWGLLLATLAGAAVSAVIEGGQLWVFAHRVPSTEDLILNTLGSTIGAGFSWGIPRRSQRRSS